MSGKYPYQEEWEDFRFRLALPFLGVPAFFAFGILLAFTREYFENWKPWLGFNPIFILPIAIFILMIAATAFVSFWKCPACEKYFGIATALDLVISKPYRAKKCKNCDMPKFYGSTFLAEKFGEQGAEEISLKWKSGPQQRLKRK